MSKFAGASEGSHYHLGICQTLSLTAGSHSIDPQSELTRQQCLARQEENPEGERPVRETVLFTQSRNIYSIDPGLLS